MRADSPIEVIQATWGKFHHFDLARQLYARKMLRRIYTTYPKSLVKNEGIPIEKIQCRWLLHTIILGLWKYNINNRHFDRVWLRAVVRDFEKWLLRELPACDSFIALSGAGLAAGQLTQRRGGIYICDRGSSHIQYGDAILKEEYARWRQPFFGSDEYSIEREKAEYAVADYITVPSTFALETFVRYGVDRRKMVRIPYGVELSRFQKVTEPRDDEFKILFVGNLSFLKGVPYLLEAFRAFEHPRKRLILVGSLRDDFKSWLSTQSIEDVEILGAVPQPQLPYIMSSSHVMVLPSITEGLAMVQGQALACGCPVICTEHTGGADLFDNEKEGFIVPIRSAKAILDRLNQLAFVPGLRDKMSRLALARVLYIRGWSEYGDQYEKLIRSAIGKRR